MALSSQNTGVFGANLAATINVTPFYQELTSNNDFLFINMYIL